MAAWSSQASRCPCDGAGHLHQRRCSRCLPRPCSSMRKPTLTRPGGSAHFVTADTGPQSVSISIPNGPPTSGTLSGTSSGGFDGMSITASEARKSLFPLIKKVNEDHDAIEIVSKHGNAVLVSADDFSALREGAYLLRSPANARRLLKAYENALNGVNLAEHQLIDPDAADQRGGDG